MPWTGSSPSGSARGANRVAPPASTTRCRGKSRSSTALGYAGVQPWRDTASAPHALAMRRGLGPVLSRKPALEESGHETVARSQDVEHLHPERLSADAFIETRGDRPLEGGGSRGPAFAHQRRLRHVADVGQSREGVGRAAGDVELLFRADDHVEARQGALQLGRHGRRFDEPVLPVPVPGEAPQVRPVVEVDDGLRARLARQIQRPQGRGLGPGMRQVGAGGKDAARLGDEVGVDVVRRQRHVGAVLAVEDQREPLLIPDAEQHQRRQAMRIGDDAADIHPFRPQLLADEAAHVLVADARDHGGFQAQPRGAGGGIGGRAADVLAERPHVFQAAAHLPAVEVHRRSADGNDVQRPLHTVPPREPSSCANSWPPAIIS